MGDRGNIVIRQDKGTNNNDVWFYAHWSGSNISGVVRKALARKQRWDDASYLSRIVFDALMEGEQGSETGHGISCRIQDNEHDILVVDIPNQRVFTIEEKELVKFRVPAKYEPKKSESFGEFIGENRLVTEVGKARQKAGVI